MHVIKCYNDSNVYKIKTELVLETKHQYENSYYPIYCLVTKLKNLLSYWCFVLAQVLFWFCIHSKNCDILWRAFEMYPKMEIRSDTHSKVRKLWKRWMKTNVSVQQNLEKKEERRDESKQSYPLFTSATILKWLLPYDNNRFLNQSDSRIFCNTQSPGNNHL